ncbi:MAG: crossover junction endodeoxyribonuclease RuvC [Bacteroidia bacterium]|nr:crossover junction endodeoxyribonuclease RuvC [Bacteroidia bacterium]
MQFTNKNTDRVILGIDPGTVIMGYGILEVRNKVLHLAAYGVLQLDKEEDGMKRLKKIFDKVSALIEQYCPDELAIEAPFYGKNVQSMLKLGRAQGTAIAASLSKGLWVNEYSPKKIKSSITGNGNASKEQVAGMVEHLLKTKIDSKFLDATDAIAVALCHYYQNEPSTKTGKRAGYKNWKDYVIKNKI